MPTNFDFLKLPWEIQAALASGYVAYMVAYAGLKGRHSAVDTAFITLVFSLIATVILSFASQFGIPWAITAAVVGCCVSGLVWRKWGRKAYRAVMRSLDVSWANDDPTALETLSGDSAHYLTAIAVQLDDGRWLRCDDTERFRDAPHGPALIGPSGDVAFYLTHEDAADGTPKELQTVRSPDFGDRITYVPASRIRMMNLRYKLNRSSKVVEVAASSQSEVVVEPSVER
jgi:uncharacterized membrane protein YeaQ/YmgE (transglycosylase-associated protein family)